MKKIINCLNCNRELGWTTKENVILSVCDSKECIEIGGIIYKRKISRAYITRDKKRINLGCFDTIGEAEMSRIKADEYYTKHGTLEGFIK